MILRLKLITLMEDQGQILESRHEINRLKNKAGYTATYVECGRAGAKQLGRGSKPQTARKRNKSSVTDQQTNRLTDQRTERVVESRTLTDLIRNERKFI